MDLMKQNLPGAGVASNAVNIETGCNSGFVMPIGIIVQRDTFRFTLWQILKSEEPFSSAHDAVPGRSQGIERCTIYLVRLWACGS
ncbi:hypothetical protein CS542_06825 [Pedobacter sp. IW39]|nr:hypothetical protein CS542_06825 [Pedobacter sp. IW39]